MEIDIKDVNVEQNNAEYIILSSILEDGFRFTQVYMGYELPACKAKFVDIVSNMKPRTLDV